MGASKWNKFIIVGVSLFMLGCSNSFHAAALPIGAIPTDNIESFKLIRPAAAPAPTATPTSTPTVASSTFNISSPVAGATINGTTQFTGQADSQWLNVAAFDVSNNYAKISFDVTPSNGSYTISVDTTQLANGTTTIGIIAFSVPAGQSGGTYSESDVSVNVQNATLSTPIPTSTPVQTTPGPTAAPYGPARSGFTIQSSDYFNSVDPNLWSVQEANSPAAINLSSDPNNIFGEVEANLPNQYVLLPGGGVGIISKPVSWSAIGGVSDKTCGDASVSYCSFPWTSSQFSGKGGLQSSYGYYEWSAKLPVVPAGGTGTWPATWLLGGDTAPQYEEIDFMERFAINPSQIDFHLHYGNGPGDYNNDNSIHFCDVTDYSGNNWSDLHTYAIDWEPTFITGYIDGVACGTIHQGDIPNEYGSTPAIIPSGFMFPIFNTAIAPNVNAITAANPVEFDVMHYLYYSNNSNPQISPLVAHLSGLQVDRAVYNPGDTVTVSYNITAGSAALTGVSLSGVAVMDFLGDSSSFQEGSTINGVFGSWMSFPLSNTINANSTYAGSFTYAIPSTLPNGIYSVFIGSLNANGQTYPGNYIRFVVGAGSLPPAP